MRIEWREATLADLGPIITGKTPSTSIAGYFEGHIPFITPSDMDGRRFIDVTARSLTEVGTASVSSSRIPANSVLVSCIGSDMGKVAISANPSVTNQQINSIVVQPPHSSLFVYYDLSRRKTEIMQAAGGSAQPILNKSAFGRLSIRLPVPSEQLAIVRVLGSLDDKIELNRRMNETLEAMARALFKSWFVDFDPVRTKSDGRTPSCIDVATAGLFPGCFDSSKLGPVPSGWQVTPLGELLELKRGYDLPAAERRPGSIPIVSSSGPSGFHNEAKVKGPGIVTGRYGTIGEVYLVSDDFWPLNTALYIRDYKGNDLSYILHLLRTFDFAKFSDKAAVPGINRNHVHMQPVCAAPRALQSRFADVTRPWFDRARAAAAESETLATLRDLLLPQLLSGELRIRDAERAVEAVV